MVDDAIVARARSLLGTRFRLHGRDPSTGLDCVGLAVCVAQDARAVPSGYPLRGGSIAGYIALIDSFCSRSSHPPCAGDLLLIEMSATQFHLGIWTGDSLVHAHAGLNRVVETPGAVEGRVIGTWKLARETD